MGSPLMWAPNAVCRAIRSIWREAASCSPSASADISVCCCSLLRFCDGECSVVALMLIGFTELCQEDQIKLIKQGSFEVIIARYVPLFTNDGMFVPDMSVKVPRLVYFVITESFVIPVYSEHVIRCIVCSFTFISDTDNRNFSVFSCYLEQEAIV